MSAVKIFKLVNGDELIGEVLTPDNQRFIVKNPLSVVLIRGANGQPAKALSDWLMLAPGIREIELHINQLLIAPVDAPKEAADAWRQETSGIILATQLNG